MTLENWIGTGMLLVFLLATAANYYWEKAIEDVTESQGFTGFSRNHKALEWARRHQDELKAAEQAATQRAITAYRFNCYGMGAVIALAIVNATIILSA